MQPLSIKLPRLSSIGTDGEPTSCGCQNQTGTRIAQNLMDVGLYIDGGVPGPATVFGSQHSSDVHIDINRALRVCRHRPHIRRPAPRCKPCVPTFSLVEGMDSLELSVSQQKQMGFRGPYESSRRREQ